MKLSNIIQVIGAIAYIGMFILSIVWLSHPEPSYKIAGIGMAILLSPIIIKLIFSAVDNFNKITQSR